METNQGTSSRHLLLISAMLSLATTAACDPCAPSDTVAPGVGLGMDGKAICMGHIKVDVEGVLGAGKVEHDLGEAGLRVAHPAHNLSVLYSPGERKLTAIYLDQGTPYKTEEGVGLGSNTAAVKAAFGAPGEDPYLQDLWYPDRGIVFQMDGGKVASIQVMSPPQSK